MDPAALFAAHGDKLEDFWGRRESGPRFRRRVHVFGRPIRVTANDKSLLDAVDVSLPLYSTAPPVQEEPLQIHLVQRPAAGEPGPPPENLFAHIQYTGHDDWLAMHVGRWGLAYVDLAAGRATMVLAPSLARAPALVSRCVLDTILTNFMESRGFSMLHATGLVHGENLLLLLGPHNSGKSTTAMHLALGGYTFIADSMVYVAPGRGPLQIVGFPVGRARLRGDAMASFPELQAQFEREMRRDEVKFGLDLRRIAPVTVQREAVTNPRSIDLCLLSRHERQATRLNPAARSDVMQAVVHNSSYWHTPAFWEQNLQRLQRLVDAARCHHLQIGTDAADIVRKVNQLREGKE